MAFYNLFFTGNGGSTLTALSFLHNSYGDEIYKFRILMIHAGGLSKRMPSTSILGKIFSPIPTGSPIYQMLDIKLAMYLPFLPRMPPGIFVCCADDFLVFSLGDEDLKWKISETGFTAFAHPSTLEIGVKHGVYVIDQLENIETQIPLQECRCLEVLQKPSEETMYKKDAVLKGQDLKFPENIQIRGKTAYTDSCFFFGMDVAKKFVNFVSENGFVECEIDAYGDFLQALGPRATVDYVYNTSNVTTVLPKLIPTREKIFHLLKGTEIKVLLMNASRFIHIGSTKEYINHFCFDSIFQRELCLQKDVFNCWTLTQNGDEASGIPAKKTKLSDTSLGCVMHSVLPHRSVVSDSSIVEYCNFDVPVEIGENTIINNCSVLSEDYSQLVKRKHVVEIPNGVFLHTVPVIIDSVSKFVTLNFDIDDNLKQQSPIHKLPFLGKSLKKFCSLFDLDNDLILPVGKKPNSQVDDGKKNDDVITLWDACLFPVMDSSTESLLKSLEIIKSVRQDDKLIDLKGLKFVSMATIMDMKNYKLMLEKRKQLFLQIQQN